MIDKTPQNGRITGIHHASLLVADIAVAQVFYIDILGLQIELFRPQMSFEGLWLNLGDGRQIHLMELPSPDDVVNRPAHGGRDRHIALTVDSLEPFAQRLEAAGVAYTKSASGREALFCRDPDGNAIELIPGG